ncbi:MAG: GNAT family N-acetyltransferase, partial [Thermomicrobiales bacterium]
MNEPDPPPAPRLFVGRTRAGNIWHYRHDLPEAVAAQLDALLREEPIATNLEQPPACLAALQVALTGQGPTPKSWSGPAWQFSDALPAPGYATVRITPADDAVVRQVYPILADDLPWREPCVAIVRDGRLASVCYSARNTPVAAEAGVDTVEEFRGRGYATAVVTAWAQAVRQDGRIPLYSTS